VGFDLRRLNGLAKWVSGDRKHNIYADFGYPTKITTKNLREIYERHAVANAAISKIVSKSWSTPPKFRLTQDFASPLSPAETGISDHFSKNRLWARINEADTRSLIGGYCAVILRIADGKDLSEQVEGVMGIEALVDIVPVWRDKIDVKARVKDKAADDYGAPTMYQVSLADAANDYAGQIVDVHPDRIMIVSETGSKSARPMLEAGYNDLLNMQKISGAGGEGFWRNAKGGPVLELDKDANIQVMADLAGIPVDELAKKMSDKVEDWQKGFDKLLMLDGMTASTVSITLPNPKEFYNICSQAFAASVSIPMKILFGSQTGERASTEDAREWAQTIESRRENNLSPMLLALADRLTKFGVFAADVVAIQWDSLTDSGADTKMKQSKAMAEINARGYQFGEPPFTVEEIRKTFGVDE